MRLGGVSGYGSKHQQGDSPLWWSGSSWAFEEVGRGLWLQASSNRKGAVASDGLLPLRKPAEGHERGWFTNAAKRRDVGLGADTTWEAKKMPANVVGSEVDMSIYIHGV